MDGQGMRKQDFNHAISRLDRMTRSDFARVYRDRHDADRDFIAFERDRIGFYLDSSPRIQDGLWEMVRS